jgi:hypothetical protein
MIPGKEGMRKKVAGAPNKEKEWKFMAVTGQVAIMAAIVVPKLIMATFFNDWA